MNRSETRVHDSEAAEINNLLNSLRYQIITPKYTTMSKCAECDNIARGGELCPTCLYERLVNKGVKLSLIDSYVSSLYAQSEYMSRADEARTEILASIEGNKT